MKHTPVYRLSRISAAPCTGTLGGDLTLRFLKFCDGCTTAVLTEQSDRTIIPLNDRRNPGYRPANRECERCGNGWKGSSWFDSSPSRAHATSRNGFSSWHGHPGLASRCRRENVWVNPLRDFDPCIATATGCLASRCHPHARMGASNEATSRRRRPTGVNRTKALSGHAGYMLRPVFLKHNVVSRVDDRPRVRRERVVRQSCNLFSDELALTAARQCGGRSCTESSGIKQPLPQPIFREPAHSGLRAARPVRHWREVPSILGAIA
jgi:hypothetical protein